MNNTIACVNDSTSISQLEFRIDLKDAVDCFSHDFNIAFNRSLTQHVMFKLLIKKWTFGEKALYFLNGSQYIIQMFFNILIHTPIVLYC